MKVTELSNKAMKFQGANMDLPIAMSGVLIRIIEIDNWLKVFIEVNENSTHENLRKTIPLSLISCCFFKEIYNPNHLVLFLYLEYIN